MDRDRGRGRREKDYQAPERELKRFMRRARRLVGKRVVMEDDVIVTAYRADASKRNRLLRRTELRNMAA
jgi:hypothetical protein